jgi:hypothetical protein
MSEVQHVTTRADAEALARHLLDARRRRPVVVVAHGVGRDAAPWIDAQRVADDVGEYAEVHVIPTGDVTWAFSAAMPPEAQVYGDAARVYGTDLAWVARPRSSRLHLCLGASRGGAIAEALVAEAMSAALSAGLLEQRAQQRRAVTGEVVGILAGRGIVRGDFGTAALRPELVAPGLPIERVVRVGQRVTGEWVSADGLLDVRDQVQSARAALAHYRVGDAVLVRVADVGHDRAVLEPYPGTRVEVRVEQITGNALDDPRDLMTVGEVVVAHVVRTGSWILTLLDVDDDEEVRPAPALLAGGPAWLEAAEPVELEPVPAWVPPEAPLGDASPSVEVDAPVEVAQEAAAEDMEARPAGTAPSPLDLDPRRRAVRPVPGPPPPPPAPALEAPAAVASPSAREVHLEREARAHARRQVDALRAENAQLVSRLHRLEQERDRALSELERKRTETLSLKKQVRRSRGAGARERNEVQFLDPEQQLRHDVLLAWADLIPAAEKRDRGLPTSWGVGADFLQSLEDVDGISRTKVLEVVVHVLTGLAETMPGRDLHRLRMGPGGDDAYVERLPGEFCWRVALQRNAPSARRLHYWKHGDRIELSRVALHDEMRP